MTLQEQRAFMPMTLAINPFYKFFMKTISPAVGVETFTRTYLRTLEDVLPRSR